jgi:tetratricopeptide (TPR) repeat protein
MTEEIEKPISPRAKRPIYLSPWLVALAALALYGCTLNPWVNFRSLPLASQIMGWDWHPGPLSWRINPEYQPLYLVLTCPLRWMPLDWRITGLNVLAAVCAALTLAILARSVKLLAHDRTKEQRVRVGGKDALLPMRASFLPAAFAVALLAGQLTFWENAVSGTGEMIDLMVFAFLILCLLEYRHTRAEGWLCLFTFVYGLGMANNWGLIGFFPCFLAALIWIKGLAFFKWRFALRLATWGALGLLFYALVPLLGAGHHDGGFWEIFHEKLAEQHILLTRMPRYFAAIAAVPSLVPLIFAGIYWPSSEGELNPGARDLTSGLFRVLHIVFLAVGVLMFFDIAMGVSPRKMGLGVVPGAPSFLSFYYLAALSVGYFSGYVLLVFGKDVEYRWGQATGLLHLTNVALAGLLWAAAVVLPAILFYRNFHYHIQDYNNPVVAQFGKEMAKSLPPSSAVVLADEPARLYLAMGAAQHLALTNQYIFMESRELTHREYLRYLADRYPSIRRELASLPPEKITPADLLAALARRGPVYYLHPSFGAYFEQVYLLPNRMGGYVRAYATNGTGLLVLDPSGVATNQAYWHALERGTLASLPDLARTDLEGMPERNADAVRIAGYYSQMVDCWGVELQKSATEQNLAPNVKSDMLKDASEQFTWAIRLNTNNTIARLNQEYNASLRGVQPSGSGVTEEQRAYEMSNLERMFNQHGTVDVFRLNMQVGRFFAEYELYRQSARMFQRCLELVPGNAPAELSLAKTYIDMGALDAATNILHHIPEAALLDPLDRARVEALAYAKMNDFERVDKVLTDAHNKYPRIGGFPDMMAGFYRLMGYSALHESKDPAAGEKAAARWFRKSLAALDEDLNLRSNLSDATAHESEILRINLQRTEMQMMLKDYSNAIVTSTAIIHQDPANPLPILNRAISELQLGQTNAAKLAAAKADYQFLEKNHGPSHIVFFGLAQIAQKQGDKKDEIRYDELYLKNAPTNTAEFTNVSAQLHKLKLESH